MGKKQHQQDKLYLTNKEKLLYGGKSSIADLQKELLQRFKRLPFGMCCLSLQPYIVPYCNNEGYIFDLENIIKFVEKYKVDPISGEPTNLKMFYKLHLSKNKDGKYQCPVIFKEFTENSHIVAIKTTGNVYSHEAVDELNFKAKNYKDLITDQAFTRKDVITLQEPTNNIDKQNISKFYYQQNSLKWDDRNELEDRGSKANLKNINQIMKATLEEMEKETSANSEANKKYLKSEVNEMHKIKDAATDKFNSATYSTGLAAASVTCGAITPVVTIDAANIGDDKYRYSQVKKKGYVQMKTNLGLLNLELFCQQCPKACENFIKLSKNNYYDGCKFHRLIKYFIIQGGDPTGTGKGGQSYWGKPFEDEFDNNFSHDKRGVLSMANSGRDTNKSQFFISLKSCKHLDKKHTIFGRLVGGFETLDKIESLSTDKFDRPTQDVIIESSSVFVDPFAEIDEQLQKEREKLAEQNSKNQSSETNNKELSKNQIENCKRKVGALINLEKLMKVNSKQNEAETSIPTSKRKKKYCYK